MESPRWREGLTAATLVAASLGVVACSADKDDVPIICQIDRPTDVGVRSEQNLDGVFSAYNVLRKDQRLYLTRDGQEAEVFFADIANNPVTLDLGGLTIEASIDQGRVQTRCLN